MRAAMADAQDWGLQCDCVGNGVCMHGCNGVGNCVGNGVGNCVRMRGLDVTRAGVVLRVVCAHAWYIL